MVRGECLSRIYLRKYWLSEEEWQNYWVPLGDSIFCPDAFRLPDMMFQEGFILIAGLGGTPFGECDFLALQKCMREVGDKSFVMIENRNVREIGRGNNFPYLRFKFPVDLTWNELHNEGAKCYNISHEVTWAPGKEYFIFGDSGLWGKYPASQYWDRSIDLSGTPLDITGFKPELASIFKQNFCFDEQMLYYESHLTEEEREEDRERLPKWLPLSYKKRML